MLKNRIIRWTSNKGRGMAVPVLALPTTLECFSIPSPDMSWMTEPPARRQFVEWMFDLGDLSDDVEYQLSAADFARLRERSEMLYASLVPDYWQYLSGELEV